MTKILLLSVGIAAALVVAIWFIIAAQIAKDLRKLGTQENTAVKLKTFDIFPLVFWILLFIVILIFLLVFVAVCMTEAKLY